jgi:hypothetical protein
MGDIVQWEGPDREIFYNVAQVMWPDAHVGLPDTINIEGLFHPLMTHILSVLTTQPLLKANIAPQS